MCERERERLHLSSPEADSGAARTSPGRFQRLNSVITTKKDKPMDQQSGNKVQGNETIILTEARPTLANKAV